MYLTFQRSNRYFMERTTSKVMTSVQRLLQDHRVSNDIKW